jgi:hypothetical protein
MMPITQKILRNSKDEVVALLALHSFVLFVFMIEVGPLNQVTNFVMNGKNEMLTAMELRQSFSKLQKPQKIDVNPMTRLLLPLKLKNGTIAMVKAFTRSGIGNASRHKDQCQREQGIFVIDNFERSLF